MSSFMERLRIKRQLRDKGNTEEEISQILTEREQEAIEETPTEDIKENISDLKEDTVKIYCFQCKEMVEAVDSEIITREIKIGSLRSFLKGKCGVCGRNISGIVRRVQ